MPSLLEIQSAMRTRLLDDSSPAAAALVTASLTSADRISIYRNTSRITLTNALRLNYPAVQLLVGEDFFAAAADLFITNEPPRTAWLDVYGATFPDFLAGFGPAASVPYLADVARLERAVSRALHAPDCQAVAPAQLASLAEPAQGCVSFVPHPAISLLASQYPVDAIWRAVLARDEAAIKAIKLDSGAVRLLIERSTGGIEVTRLEERPWHFAGALFAGRRLPEALDLAGDPNAPVWLAAHLAAGHFVSFAVNEAAHAPAALERRQ
ncbi:MAG TPA: DNA-binding domain-containing protein [Xanthobacteraceae bacterium]|nr:DNA-binding domain-containing protein [Xanthobacteraceae bacterium]